MEVNEFILAALVTINVGVTLSVVERFPTDQPMTVSPLI